MAISVTATLAGSVLVSGDAKAYEVAGAGEAAIYADPIKAATPAEAVGMSDGMFLAMSAVDDQKPSRMLDKAMNHLELDRIAQGWVVTGTGFGGMTEPLNLTDIQFTLRLPPHVENTLDCDSLMAKIQVDINTEEVIRHSIPGEDAECSPPLLFSRAVYPSDAE